MATPRDKKRFVAGIGALAVLTLYSSVLDKLKEAGGIWLMAIVGLLLGIPVLTIIISLISDE